MSWVLHDLGFEYLLTKTQSVYFLLELSVHDNGNSSHVEDINDQ